MTRIGNRKGLKKSAPFTNVINKIRVLKSINKKENLNKEMLQRLFHPDYILFDWEYFSRESEFE